MGKTIAVLLASFFISNPSVSVNSAQTSLRSIIVQGDENCSNKTGEALALLESKAEPYFDRVLENVGMIQCVEQGSGMHADANLPIYHAGRETVNAGEAWYASTIVHDACHSGLYNDYLDSHEGAVPYEVWIGKKAELICLKEQYNVLKELNAENYVLEYVQNMMNYAYWDIPQEERNW